VARLFLVRHGEAAAGFDHHLDPGLSALGREQAQGAADRLSPLPKMTLATSPMRRARETAEPLERVWSLRALVRPAIGEIQAPCRDPAERRAWLNGIMEKRWADLDESFQIWRGAVIDALLACAEDQVLFTHFVAINVAVGAALGDDRVTCFWPDNASITILESKDGRLSLIETGSARATMVR
jgi:broad specificity phosphatase PhoE